MPQIQQNVEKNLGAEPHLLERVECVPLAWGDSQHAAAIGKADLVLCSDCLYREETHTVLLQTLTVRVYAPARDGVPAARQACALISANDFSRHAQTSTKNKLPLSLLALTVLLRCCRNFRTRRR